MNKIVNKRVPATTTNITKGIVNFLISEGHSASRVNTTGVWDVMRQTFRRSGGRKGFYDIAATIKTRYYDDKGANLGLTLMVDVKRGRDELSQEQVDFKSEIEEAGGITFESQNYNDFVEWYNFFVKTNYL